MLEKIFGEGFKKQVKTDKLFDVLNYIALAVVLLIILYPLYFIVIASFSSPDAVTRGQVWFFPVGFNVEGYQKIFEYGAIWTGYANSLKYTIVGTAINLAVTIPAAFAFSRKEMVGKGFLMGLFTFTMFFSGGLVPTFLLMQDFHLTNTMWALVLPGAVSVYNLIVARSFFDQNIPNELFEASTVDGCNYIQYFFRIVLPISKPIIAVMFLIYAVGHWNSYFSALIYLTDRDLYPLQVILREVLVQQQSIMGGSSANLEAVEQQRKLAEMIKYGVIIVSSVPVLCIYPFVQKHFVKGMMIGSVKG